MVDDAKVSISISRRIFIQGIVLQLNYYQSLFLYFYHCNFLATHTFLAMVILVVVCV